MKKWIITNILYVAVQWAVSAQEPALPEGLLDMDHSEPARTAEPVSDPDDEPELPSGLFGDPVEEPDATPSSSLPALPDGLSDHPGRQLTISGASEDQESQFQWGKPTGFAETRLGTRARRDTDQKNVSIGEWRLHLESALSWKNTSGQIGLDLLADPIQDEFQIDLERGTGLVDLRDAYVVMRPSSHLDLKLGRQIATWGTGDLLFINDLFPKDWNSFLSGRDQEFLKSPSDAVKLSFFSDLINLDFVYTPEFDADRYIDGRRHSYFHSGMGQVVGRSQPVLVDDPDRWFSDDEVALRLHRLFGAWESAAYYYHGFWKSPAGLNPVSMRNIFPELDVFGASLRGPLAGGIANAEIGYYDSRQDRDGNNPLIWNSEWRFLLGYEREILPEFVVSTQYYLESIDNFTALRTSMAPGMPVPDKNRHVVTFRLTKLLMNQNLNMSLFTFFSPSESDMYIRPKVAYKFDDHWTAEIGGNIFCGRNEYTFFGQFADNTNAYVALRYGF